MLNSEILNNLWCEKYRPKNLNQIILSNDLKEQFQNYIKEKSIPNIMFVGNPGSGKTTLSRILVEHIIDEDCDLLMFNGSTSTGVENIRENVTSFLMSSPYGNSKIKIVYIDEADYLSQNAQAALRNIIESNYETGRFIFTLNYPFKIIDPLHSRFQMFKLDQMKKEDILKHLIYILDNESITYNLDVCKLYIDRYYPDIRKTINEIQSNCINSVLSTDIINNQIVEKKIISYVKDMIDCIEKKGDIVKYIKEVETLLKNNDNIDFYIIYQTLFDESIPIWAKIHVGESFDNIQNVAIIQMHFITCLYKIIKSGIEFNKLKG